MKQELIKISLLSLKPRIAIAFDLVFHYYVPSGDDFVTLMIDTDIKAYKENDADMYRSDNAQEVYLNLTDRKTRIIENNGKRIELKLVRSSVEKFQNKYFRFYEILVSEPES